MGIFIGGIGNENQILKHAPHDPYDPLNQWNTIDFHQSLVASIPTAFSADEYDA
jgi:hypothetical protein